ncbi:DUF1800 domain-containing protein [Halioxenophilus aromaticivorans]|uniref:DUF1800 domain-containing protein n=1 Tax=Halioxenophilus aromaticivorans TaxID=1306992 RepID=A0AAV3U1H9_9ALTE
MPKFDPTIAEVRFGTGLSVASRPSNSTDDMIKSLTGPDTVESSFPIHGMPAVQKNSREIRQLKTLRQKKEITKEELKARRDTMRNSTQQMRIEDYSCNLARGVASDCGFKERLTWFWADHFSVVGNGLKPSAYIDTAIRPNIASSFTQMLQAAILHPVMILYLDQGQSTGPNSQAAKRNNKRGLNENLAREILELHTLGVQAGYSQQDVRTFAKLLAGTTLSPSQETVFNPRLQEPGPLAFMGFETTGDANREADIRSFLAELATRKATAEHLAFKMAQHFLMDDPPKNLVRKMTKAYLANNGSLLALYEVLLNYPLSMSSTLFKVKRPIEYMVSALRALDVKPEALVASAKQNGKAFNREMLNAMARMGQRWGQPSGPNGWPKTNPEWVSPNTVSERLRWALRVQTRQFVNPLEPSEVLANALGPLADDGVRWAVKAAETKKEAIALLLMSPAFQRH